MRFPKYLRTLVRNSCFCCFCCFFALACFAAKANEHHHILIDTTSEAQFAILPSDEPNANTQLVLSSFDQELVFDLQENNKLLSPNVQLDRALELTLYKGVLEGAENSWARFTYHNGNISGAYFDGENLFFVSKRTQIDAQINHVQRLSEGTSDLLIYNANDVQHDGTCALHDDHAASEFSYQNYIDNLNELTNNAATKELRVSLVADVEFEASDSELAAVEMTSEMNIVDGIFSEQVGVALIIDEIRVLADNANLTSTDAQDLIVAYRTYVASQ